MERRRVWTMTAVLALIVVSGAAALMQLPPRQVTRAQQLRRLVAIVTAFGRSARAHASEPTLECGCRHKCRLDLVWLAHHRRTWVRIAVTALLEMVTAVMLTAVSVCGVVWVECALMQLIRTRVTRAGATLDTVGML